MRYENIYSSFPCPVSGHFSAASRRVAPIRGSVLCLRFMVAFCGSVLCLRLVVAFCALHFIVAFGTSTLRLRLFEYSRFPGRQYLLAYFFRERAVAVVPFTFVGIALFECACEV